jgi:hypothetical protein
MQVTMNNEIINAFQIGTKPNSLIETIPFETRTTNIGPEKGTTLPKFIHDGCGSQRSLLAVGQGGIISTIEGSYEGLANQDHKTDFDSSTSVASISYFNSLLPPDCFSDNHLPKVPFDFLFLSIANDIPFRTETFVRDIENGFVGKFREVSHKYILEYILLEDVQSFMVRKPNSFLIVSQLIQDRSNLDLLLCFKKYTNRASLKTSTEVFQGRMQECTYAIFHHVGGFITLCTANQQTDDCPSQCLCEIIPILCYKVFFRDYAATLDRNRKILLQDDRTTLTDFGRIVQQCVSSVIEPLGFHDLFKHVWEVPSGFYVKSFHATRYLMVIEDNSDNYEDISFLKADGSVDFTAPIRIYWDNNGMLHTRPDDMRKFIRKVIESYMTKAQMPDHIRHKSWIPGLDTLGELKETVDKLTELGTDTKALIEFVQKNWQKAAVAVCACVGSYVFLRAYFSGDYEPLHRICAILIPVFALVPAHIRTLFDFFSTTGETMAQGPGDIPWDSIVTLVLGATQYAAGVTNPRFSVKEFTSILTTLPRASEGFSKVLNSLVDVFGLVFNKVKEYMFEEVSIPISTSFFPKVQEFLQSVSELVELHNKSTLLVNVFHYDKITRLQTEGINLLVHGRFGNEQRNVIAQVKTFLTMLDKIRKPFEQSTIRASFSRVEPLTILVRGVSGVGKSTMSKPFLACLLAKILPSSQIKALEENMDQFIYTRNPELKYWDGYKGQFVTVMDDFAQCFDVAGDPDNEYMSLIRCTNRFPYVLHMASLEDKGNNVFNSKVIFCTTNETNFNTVTSIKSKEALIRRFDYIVDVVVDDTIENDQYIYGERREGCEDLKIRKNLPFSHYKTDAWNINIMTGVNATSPGEVEKTVKFDQFVDMCANVYHEKMAVFEDINNGTEEILSEAIYQRKREDIVFDSDDEFVGGFSANLLEIITDEPIKPRPSIVQRIWLKYKMHFPSWEKFLQLYDYFIIVELQKMNNRLELLYDEYFDAYVQLVILKFKDLNGKYKTVSDYAISLTKRIGDFMTKKCDVSIQSALLRMTRLATQTKEFIAKHPLLVFFGFWATAAVGIKIFISLTTPVANSAPGNNRKMRGKRKHNSRGNMVYEDVGQPYSQDLGSSRIGHKVFHKNCMTISLPGNDPDEDKSGLVIGIRGNICLLPLHYLRKLEREIDRDSSFGYETIEFYFMNGDPFRSITVNQFMSFEKSIIENRDMFLFSMNSSATLFPNITKHFVSHEMLKSINQAECTFYSIDSCTYVRPQCNEVLATKCTNGVFYTDFDGVQFESDSAFKFDADTKPGDCGTLLINNNSTLIDGVILGVHVAGRKSLVPGYTGYGFASIVTRELLSTAISALNIVDAQGPIMDPLVMNKTEKTRLYDSFPVFAEAKDSCALSAAPKSSLVKMDDFYGLMGKCIIKPAYLHEFKDENGEQVNPLSKAILKYYGEQLHIDSKLVKICVAHTFASMKRDSKYAVPKGILSFEEAVEGIHGEQFIGGLARGTSAGWPKVKTKASTLRGKKPWFGTEGDYKFDSEYCAKLKLEVLQILENAKKGIRSSVVFMDCLKDETRPIEKVNEGKTRLISAAPLAYVIACRMVYMRFTQWIMKNRIANGIAVGVNAYSKEWDAIVERLHEVSELSFAGDYGNFDSGQHVQVGNQINDSINDWYDDGDEWALCRRTLFIDVYSSVHITGRYIYQWVKGMPSGHPLTTILNSIYNRVLIRMGYVTAMDCNYAALNHFNKNIRDLVYGDDNIVSVHESVRDKFNIQSFAAFIESIGMKYTDETKTSVISSEFRPITNISFLKRSFVWDKDLKRFIAPLEWDTVRQMLYYLRKNIDMTQVICSASNSFLMEASLHSKERFDLCIRTYEDIWLTKSNFVPKTTNHRLAREFTLSEELRY